jgi:hypothetical protein
MGVCCTFCLLYSTYSSIILYHLISRAFALQIDESKVGLPQEIKNRSTQRATDSSNYGVFVCQYLKRLMSGNLDLNFTDTNIKSALGVIRDEMSQELRDFKNLIFSDLCDFGLFLFFFFKTN